jgi:RNA recognition motif-containing protein
MIADAKGTRTNPRAQSREPEDLPPRSRLFVICSKVALFLGFLFLSVYFRASQHHFLALYSYCMKDYSEDDVTARFKPYGEIEYCKVIKDKQTNESKGFAYVKFAKASAAALAMEEVNRLAQENGTRANFFWHFLRFFLLCSSGLKIKALIADPKSKNKGDGPLPVSYPPLPVISLVQLMCVFPTRQYFL